MGRLVIDGGNVYELDENCLREKMEKEKQAHLQRGRNSQSEMEREENNAVKTYRNQRGL